jgi:hypothetical protein
MQLSNLKSIICVTLIAAAAWCNAAEYFGAACVLLAIVFFLVLPPVDNSKQQSK